MPKIRLLIASAHVIVRTALGTLLKGVRDFDVIGEVDLSHLVRTPVQLSPDVFLVELTEAGLRGLRLAANLLRGYVLRSARNDELYEAIRIVYRGQTVYRSAPQRSIADLLLGGARNLHLDQAARRKVPSRELMTSALAMMSQPRSLLPPPSQGPIQLDQAAKFVTLCTCE